jgi:hypothetical protein
MSADFETVMQALLARLQTLIPDFVTVGRRVIHWNQVANQPALFLRRIGTHDSYQGHLPVTTIDCEIWIYCNAGQDPTQAPDATLTTLENKVRAAMAPNDQMRFTLNNLVYWCRIEGKSDISPGDQGAQSIARIPVKITLPF